MNLIERLAQAQAQERQIQQQIAAYQQEIERLAPQLWGVKGRVSLLMEMVQEEERMAQEAERLAQEAAQVAPEVVQTAQEQPE